jgi:hypothetical protein
MLSLAFQLLLPLRSMALSTGPSQPEVQGFEPVGTTEMVDLFSGDFTYNIPLMDIDGYPVNISYHSGASMEQEASWVGLGWSLNTGEINRSVRGIPDDFNNDNITKSLHIEDEHNFMGRTGVEFNAEYLGFDFKKLGLKIGADLSVYMNQNNYKGMSLGLRAGLSVAYAPSSGNPASSIGFSPSIGVGSQSGVDIDASLRFALSNKTQDRTTSSASLSVGSGINSRNGITAVNFSCGLKREQSGGLGTGFNALSTVPIGLQNYVPVITNVSNTYSYSVQGKLGPELEGAYINGFTGFTYTLHQVDGNGSPKACGYMYLENASKDYNGILDFIRDKDGAYNKTIKNLPLSSLAYDIYSVSAQGTGGSFRPFRNDVGTVYDPATGGDESLSASLALEAGLGYYFEVGGDVSINHNIAKTGPWLTADFQGEKPGTLYEKLFFKQAGELTYNRQAANNPLYLNDNPLSLVATYGSANPFVMDHKVGQLTFTNSSGAGTIEDNMQLNGMEAGRTSRANLITPLTAVQAANSIYSPEPVIASYSTDANGNISATYLDRIIDNDPGSNRTANASWYSPPATGKLKDRISLIAQTLPDGRRYIYGIPALNNTTEDISFGAIDPNNADNVSGGLIEIGPGQTSTPSASAIYPEKYFSSSTTPAYAHSFLLTEVLSPDYVDITGNGCSDDDIGGFVRINYTRTSAHYHWRSPAYNISSNSVATAHFDPGFQSDSRDGKAAVSKGDREQWYVHSIESKNLIAEFITSDRDDALGMPEPVSTPGTIQPQDRSKKLDCIRLYSKSDRVKNGNNAVPIKTIFFKYDYSLCQNTPNSVAGGKGKLTLKAIYTRYGASDKNLASPYRFEYNTLPGNTYDYKKKDRWGNSNNMDPAFAGVDPFEFPYTSQAQYNTVNANPATAFSLNKITLPSGGTINVEYEADDYAYVQDKRAMQMFKLKGLGTSPSFQEGNALYEGDNQYNYLYFERDLSREFAQANTDLRKIYLENETHLYYSVSTEIRNGAYEQIKGFGEVEDVGACQSSPPGKQYGYIKLKKVNSSNCDFSPVTLYAMNFAKFNLNHIVYPGYNTNDPIEVLKAFSAAIGEIGHLRRPLQTFLERGYCRNVNLTKSWIRLQSPNLAKKGGGIRVKRLYINDSWGDMNPNSGHANGTYGKEYDYTITDDKYGVISSGVASYEPLIGGDENPLRKPIPYIAKETIALPAMEFYQLEPLGENFYPGGSVGYSSVRVRSIHIDEGKSSMSEEENQFYTAKDYPIRVEYTDKQETSIDRWALLVQDRLEQVAQGYTLYLNDMHGKPKAKYSYVIKEYDPAAVSKVADRKMINGVVYHYNSTGNKLNSTVKALRLEKYVNGGYNSILEDVDLGKETDLTFDSRQNYDQFIGAGVAANLNVMSGVLIPIPIVSFFPSFTSETNVFHSMVATKIVQQYGILSKVETFEDQQNTTTTENLVYDAESGRVLLSRTSNEFNDNEYTQSMPAYLAYEGMAPAYTNIGFIDQPNRLYVNRVGDGYMDVVDPTIYSEGDELRLNLNGPQDKIWVTKKGQVSTADFYGFNIPGQTCLAFFSGDAYTYNITISSGSTVYNTTPLTTTPAGSDPWHYTFSASPGGNYIFVPSNIAVNIDIVQAGVSSTLSHASITTYDPFVMYNITKCNPGAAGNGSGIGGSNGPAAAHSEHSYDFVAGPFCAGPVGGAKCMLRVNTRYKYIHPNGSTNNTYWWAQSVPKDINLTNATTEIVRSGRRNMLNTDVQSLTSTQAPALNTGTLSGFMINNGIISVSAQTFDDEATPYGNFDKSLVDPLAANTSSVIYEGLNDYLLGLRGSFRPYRQYVAFANRSYSANTHSRVDGTFSLGTKSFWTPGTFVSNCGPWSIISGYGPPDLWKKKSEVTKYDMFGNALEEINTVNIAGTAQYGYGARLPVAVANNAVQGSILFEGFEDHAGFVMPDVLAHLMCFGMSANIAGIAATRLATGYTYSPFLRTSLGGFNPVSSFICTNGYYTGNTSFTTNSTAVVSSGSSYGNAHTGTQMLALRMTSTPIPVASSYSPDVIQPFTLVSQNKYLVNLWVKQMPTATSLPAMSVDVNYAMTPATYTTATFPLNPKGVPVEGWQLMEGVVDLASINNLSGASLTVASPVLIDDVRMLPFNASMKSYVYDVQHNNRLSAELDENHYAKFFEYDQEGQLIRVKKETEKGIVTLSESRRAIKPNP